MNALANAPEHAAAPVAERQADDFATASAMRPRAVRPRYGS